MKNIILAITSLLFCFSQLSLQAQTEAKPKLAFEETVVLADQSLEEVVTKKKAIGIGAGVAQGGEIIWQNAKGSSDVETGAPIKPTTIGRIASIVKPMTAVAIFQLYERGLIDLDASIKTYLPSYPHKEASKITVRHLLSHSSGIKAYKNNKERENKKHYDSIGAAMDRFSNRKLEAQPGKEFNYTSYGYVVLGAIIESASGMTYEDYMQKNVFDKADMQQTSVEDARKTYDNKTSFYHRSSNGKVKPAWHLDSSDRIPGGGFQTTVEDLLKFGMTLLNDELISRASLEMMMTDTGMKKEGNPYGMGWFLYGKNPQLGEVIGHTGGQAGCSSFMMILPESNAVVATIANTSGVGQEVAGITTGLFKMIYSKL